jgi:hypothetical protein
MVNMFLCPDEGAVLCRTLCVLLSFASPLDASWHCSIAGCIKWGTLIRFNISLCPDEGAVMCRKL